MTTARRHIGGWIEQSSVFSAVTRKLDTSLTRHHFKWLLEGGNKDKRRIGAHMGMAPMLLHRLSQITHFCAKLAEVKFYANEVPPLSDDSGRILLRTSIQERSMPF